MRYCNSLCQGQTKARPINILSGLGIPIMEFIKSVRVAQVEKIAFQSQIESSPDLQMFTTAAGSTGQPFTLMLSRVWSLPPTTFCAVSRLQVWPCIWKAAGSGHCLFSTIMEKHLTAGSSGKITLDSPLGVKHAARQKGRNTACSKCCFPLILSIAVT